MTKVYIIVGLGRSGTTIIGKKISERIGGTFGGELVYLGSKGVQGKTLCGCGESTLKCKFWKNIFTNFTQQEIDLLIGAEESLRLKNIFKNNTKYKALFKKLHLHVAEESVLVDSSKIFPYALLFRKELNYEFIHIIRDPLKVTNSMMSKKYIPDIGGFGYLDNGGIFRTPFRWMLINALVKLFLRPRYTIIYEDFVANPEATLSEIPIVGQNSISNHSVAGNPARFEEKKIEKQPERIKFSILQKFIIRALTINLCRRS